MEIGPNSRPAESAAAFSEEPEWQQQAGQDGAGRYAPSYGNLVHLNHSRLILDAVGEEALADIARDFLDLLGTSSAVYERNGDYALGIFASGWCRFLDQASFRLCGTDDPTVALDSGKWLCHESCWSDASRTAIEQARETEVACPGGLRLLAVPIHAEGQAVGAINFGYGTPPTDEGALAEIAEQYRVDPAELKRQAEEYLPRTPALIEMARNRLRGAARLIGTMVEREIARRQLGDSERRLRSLVASMDEGMCLHELVRDSSGRAVDYRILEVNRAYERITGISQAQAVGALASELYGIGTPPYLEIYARVAEHGAPERFETFYAGMDKHFGISVFRPEAERFGTVFTDITEHKRAVEALRESEENYRQLFDAESDAIFLIDNKTGRILQANLAASDLYGYSHDELLALRNTDLSGEPEETAQVTQKTAVDFEQVITIALRWHRRKDGTTFPVEISGRFFTHRGQPVHIAAIRDITERVRAEEERKHLEEQIQHVQKLESLGVLAGGIAHDFNNILMAILGNADLAHLELPVSSPARANVIEIEQAARRAADLCRQMLAYSGKGRFVVETVDLSQVVREMAEMLKISVSKKAALRYEFAPDLPPVEVDVTQLRQIVMNLITNASESLGDDVGVISISSGAMHCDRSYLAESYLDEGIAEGRYVFLEVSDSGCGMAEGVRSRIFDPFFSTKFTGRGLGLAAVLGIVRGHRGAIKVYSEPGRGTTFKVLLPAADGNPEETIPGDSPASRWIGQGTVLMADDEVAVRKVGEQMLQHLGFDTVLAADGAQAMELFAQNPDGFECVILDLMMPNMGGEEAFRELRRLRSDVRVILSSGYNQQEVTQKFAGKGLAGFIQKPYRLQQLQDALQAVLAAGK